MVQHVDTGWRPFAGTHWTWQVLKRKTYKKQIKKLIKNMLKGKEGKK